MRSGPWCTTLVIPACSTWTPGPHWHEHYTEYLKVIKGRAKVVLNGVAIVVTEEDGRQEVPRGVVHEFMRADEGKDVGNGGEEGDVVVEEWTDPCECTSWISYPCW